MLCPSKQQASAKQRDDDARTADRQQEFASLAVHQQDAANGHQEIHESEKNVAPMSLHIGKAALQKNVGVVPNDGVDAGCLVARKDDAGKNKWDHILSAQKRFLNFRAGYFASGRALRSFGGGRLFHFRQFNVRLFVGARAKKRRVGGIAFLSAKEPARRLCHHDAADHEQNARRQRNPENAAPGRVFKCDEPDRVAEFCDLVRRES